MLEESMKELQITVDELDKRMDSLDDESKCIFTTYIDYQYYIYC